MLDDRFAWLDELPDMRISGVPGVPGVHPQKSAILDRTPPIMPTCSGVPAHTSEHLNDMAGVPDKTAEIRACTPGTPCTPDIDGGWGLPTDLFWSIRRLNLDPGNRSITEKQLWPGLVIDTTLFAKRGWAAKALALGWTEQELFALSPTGSWSGLTPRLYGSQVIALDADAVTIREPRGPYRLRRTKPTKDAIMLWDLGL